MAKRAGKIGAAETKRTDSAEYELHVRGKINMTDERIEAELRSPALDPAMHPKGFARVDINTDVKEKPKPTAVLDAFHLESLAEYVRGQEHVRKTLEKALKRDQRGGDPDGPKIADDVWSRAKVQSLELRRRDRADPKTFAALKEYLGAKLAREELAAYDPPGTRSFFTVVLECDWDEDHPVWAPFRDGKLIELRHG